MHSIKFRNRRQLGKCTPLKYFPKWWGLGAESLEPCSQPRLCCWNPMAFCTSWFTERGRYGWVPVCHWIHSPDLLLAHVCEVLLYIVSCQPSFLSYTSLCNSALPHVHSCLVTAHLYCKKCWLSWDWLKVCIFFILTMFVIHILSTHVYPLPLELLSNWDNLLKLMEGQVRVPWHLVGRSSPGAVASVYQLLVTWPVRHRGQSEI